MQALGVVVAHPDKPAIANMIGVHKSTLSRELRRNGPNRARISRQDGQLIEGLLHEQWSPEQISLWLGNTGMLAVSHE